MTAQLAHTDRAQCLHLFTGASDEGPYLTVGGVRSDVPECGVRLMVWLALRRSRVDRNLTAGTLWPCVDDRRAAGNLRTALWRLRGCGIELVESDKTSLALRTDVDVDVHIAADWARRVIGGEQRDSDLRIVPWFAAATDLLPGWGDDWVIFERERLRHRTLHAFERLSQLLSAAGQFMESIAAARTVVAADPMRESAQRALVEAHLCAGDIAESHRVLRDYTALHRRVFGVDPSPLLGQTLSAWIAGRTVTRP
jgi:DNA-binding SARP family transcriptional activator